jgi:hypothetical protein
MTKRIALLAAFLGGAVFALCLTVGTQISSAQTKAPVPVSPEETDVPEPPAADNEPDVFAWNELEFTQSIPLAWGTVFSINRVQKGGESYTFWFLSTDGTLRGITTREFTGPNRASFFPEVYVIRRR